MAATAQLTNAPAPRSFSLTLTNAQQFMLILDANDIATIAAARGTNFNVNFALAMCLRQQADMIRRQKQQAIIQAEFRQWLKTQTNAASNVKTNAN